MRKLILTTTCLMMLAMLSAASAARVEKRYTVPIEGSPSIGPAKADITIIEFIDYQ